MLLVFILKIFIQQKPPSTVSATHQMLQKTRKTRTHSAFFARITHHFVLLPLLELVAFTAMPAPLTSVSLQASLCPTFTQHKMDPFAGNRW